MSFVERRINLQFQLGTGSFGEGGANVVSFSGLRCECEITKAGGLATGLLDLRVWGLSLSVMNHLTLVNQIALGTQRNNYVIVEAGDDKSGMAVVFEGDITEAWADFHGMPDVAFHARAQIGRFSAIRPIPATSFKGTADVATILSGIAAQFFPPLTLQNSGVNQSLTDCYFPGTAMDQLAQVIVHANIHADIDNRNVLAIWPAGGSRGATQDGQAAPSGALIPVLSADTGMVGYPDFTANTIRVRSLFNPSLTIGQTVEIRTQLPGGEQFNSGSGQFVIANTSHSLSSQVPGGPWFTQIECGIKGLPSPIIG